MLAAMMRRAMTGIRSLGSIVVRPVVGDRTYDGESAPVSAEALAACALEVEAKRRGHGAVRGIDRGVHSVRKRVRRARRRLGVEPAVAAPRPEIAPRERQGRAA